MRVRCAVAVAVALCACGPAPAKLRPLGSICKVNADCEARLVCVDLEAHFVSSNDAGCSAGSAPGPLHVCSTLCASDDDCALLGTPATCSFAGCATVGYCLTPN